MKRRDFIALLGGAAAAWPFAVRAQQPAERIRRIGAVIRRPPQIRAKFSGPVARSKRMKPAVAGVRAQIEEETTGRRLPGPPGHQESPFEQFLSMALNANEAVKPPR